MSGPLLGLPAAVDEVNKKVRTLRSFVRGSGASTAKLIPSSGGSTVLLEVSEGVNTTSSTKNSWFWKDWGGHGTITTGLTVNITMVGTIKLTSIAFAMYTDASGQFSAAYIRVRNSVGTVIWTSATPLVVNTSPNTYAEGGLPIPNIEITGNWSIEYGAATLGYWDVRWNGTVGQQIVDTNDFGTVTMTQGTLPGDGKLPSSCFNYIPVYNAAATVGTITKVISPKTYNMEAWIRTTASFTVAANNGVDSYISDYYSPVRSASLAAGSTTTNVVLDAAASTSDNYYNGKLLVITGGTHANQVRKILDYVGGTKTATLDRPFETAPSTDTYRIENIVAENIGLESDISSIDYATYKQLRVSYVLWRTATTDTSPIFYWSAIEMLSPATVNSPDVGSVPKAFAAGAQAANNTILSISGSGWLFTVGSDSSSTNFFRVEIDGVNIAGVGKHLQCSYVYGPCLIGMFRFDESLVVKSNLAYPNAQINYCLD